MKDAVLISIRPKWCELIASGKKTIEVRKTRPKIETPFKCYIYQTMTGYVSKSKENDILVPTTYGKVIGEFVCDGIIVDKTLGHDEMFYTAACLTAAEVAAYCTNDEMYGWHISDLVIYDEPKKLQEFYGYCNGYCGSYCKWYSQCSISEYSCALNCRPPQNWCYVEVSE